ncbi:alpha/beta hydrolase [Aestuariicella hydrocarbonica]|uniref:Alpha/beta hydrolase n=1 Tax=Pseudomaricurvus hydrocarbonicus TaxID=1470433 RepID=A0A9E5MNA2_9GAMM|nr:alpha/beta hydrolase [Aestuariicella hydrocarbonica]NHO67357.1 alpha/beta hydrolase [Aestuariicella hydrocarbonica]
MTTVVLLPGLICDHANWAAQQEALLDAGYETLIIDYGNADTIAHMAKIVLSQAPEQFIVIGHSMGGRVALEVVRQASERVTALILMDTGYLPLAQNQQGQQEVAGRMALVEQAQRDGMRAMGELWMQGMVLPEHLQDQQLCNAILDMIERKTPEQFANQQHALIDRPNARAVLSALTCPTCFICGDQDAWSPLERHHEMARLVPGAPPVFSIKNSGHMSTMEQPESVNDVILSWLQTL